MDEQKSAIPNGCPGVPDGGLWILPKFGRRGARIGFFHQHLRVAALLIKYFLTEHYLRIQSVFNFANIYVSHSRLNRCWFDRISTELNNHH